MMHCTYAAVSSCMTQHTTRHTHREQCKCVVHIYLYITLLYAQRHHPIRKYNNNNNIPTHKMHAMRFNSIQFHSIHSFLSHLLSSYFFFSIGAIFIYNSLSSELFSFGILFEHTICTSDRIASKERES